MKKIIFICCFMCIGILSCSNSTDNKDMPYHGESAIKNGIRIYPSSDSIGYNDTFSVFTSLDTQLYRMKGELKLYGGYRADSSIMLISPNAFPVDVYPSYITINIDLYPEQDFNLEWIFISDSIRVLNSQNRYSRGFYANLRIDSIYLDMDTLYGGSARPVAVPEKRWYNINDTNDIRILTGPLVFFYQFFRLSNQLNVYYKKN